jgi:hypothetical protein
MNSAQGNVDAFDIGNQQPRAERITAQSVQYENGEVAGDGAGRDASASMLVMVCLLGRFKPCLPAYLSASLGLECGKRAAIARPSFMRRWFPLTAALMLALASSTSFSSQ